MGVVLQVLVKKGPLGIHSLQTGNLHYGHFGDRYFEQLPYGVLVFPKDGVRMDISHQASRSLNGQAQLVRS